jgi:hypothetical protein
MIRRALTLCLALGGLAAAGCETTGPTPPPQDIATVWANPTPARKPVVRVLAPPFEDRTGYGAEARLFRQEVLDALDRRGGYEIVPIGEAELREELPASVFAGGTVPRRALISAARRFQADGVLFGVLKRYRPYEPLAAGLTLELVASDDGASVWSVDGLFDAALKTTEDDARNYHETVTADPRSLEGWRLTLLSPGRFAAYVAHRLAGKVP